MADPVNEPWSEDEGDGGALDFSAEDWGRLRALRASFLAAEAGVPAEFYWQSRRDFELYDATFAQRIGWKWDAVLRELQLRGVRPDGIGVVDWGCGTGIAARRFVAATSGVRRVYLCDRSKQATWFARDALLAEVPGIGVKLQPPPPDEPFDVLLVSHVLSELDGAGLAPLLELARRARHVVWVEPGSRPVSRALSAVREQLRTDLDVLAPCTHAAACGALAAEREDAWCHFFGRPPAEAFTSAFWKRFSDELGIDLRALPYAFLALRQRGEPVERRGVRVVGRPRLLKGRALLDVCDSSGLREHTLFERDARKLFKRLDRSGAILLAEVRAEGQRLIEFNPIVEP